MNSKVALSIDNGSSHIKGIFDDPDHTFIFPNVVAQPVGERILLTEQGDPLDFLDVHITSPAIESDQYRHVYVGNLAIGDEGVVHEIVGDKAAQKRRNDPRRWLHPLQGRHMLSQENMRKPSGTG
ncbi:acetate and sugar kinases/Hsc70/actin family protein [Effusibacillus dendaii]|uniref:hypothetical protein n=1 Tax=Effusibacillus dendaii TaxID=2743772 RepID=UPI00190C9D10|nr:hypothetical protein [Effusibacillus dendaii]